MLKKNIAKLLVFAMLLSMLPFTAAGEEPGNDAYAIITNDSVTVAGVENSQITLKKAENSPVSSTQQAPYLLEADTDANAVEVDSTTRELTVGFTITPATATVTYLGLDGQSNTAAEVKNGGSVSYKITLDTVATEASTITPQFKVSDSAKDSYYKLSFSVKAQAADKTYTVDVKACEHGSVSADKSTAAENDEVTLTITPNSGYELDKLTVLNGSDEVAVTDNKFTMPAADVTVHATFKPIAVEKVELNKTATILAVEATETLTATVTPSTATAHTVSWSSSSNAIATVNSSGLVTAVKAGTATITATAGGKSAQCTVTVTQPVTAVQVAPESVSMVVNGTQTLTATVSPADATDQTVTWSSSDSEVATAVDGVVTAKKAGTTTITATAGAKSASCTVTVSDTEVAVTGITLNTTAHTMKVGDAAYTLKADVTPANATTTSITWTSSDDNVASVANGVVTAKAEGTATITVQSGSVTATCAITVQAADPVLHVLTVNVDDPAKGSAKAQVDGTDATQAIKDATVNIIAEANEGYEIDTVTTGSSDVTVTKTETGGTFTMPDTDVTVTVTFKEKTSEHVVNVILSISVDTF